MLATTFIRIFLLALLLGCPQSKLVDKGPLVNARVSRSALPASSIPPPTAPTKFSPWSLPRISRTDKRNIKLLFLIGLLSIETSSELFVRIPLPVLYGATPPPIERTAKDKNILLVFPGAGGPDGYTEALKGKIKASDRLKNVDRLVKVYNWQKWTGNFIRASFDAQTVGRTVCSELAESEKEKGKIENLHVIGISVGSFAADSCIKAYNGLADEPGFTRATFLDPFTSKGIFGYGWGLRNFGATASFAEDYLNTDDSVPTTNDPLELAFTYDVTKSSLRDKFVPMNDGDSTHSWPVAYLAKTWETEADEKGQLINPISVADSTGKVTIVN
jgi:hypothetical protein